MQEKITQHKKQQTIFPVQVLFYSKRIQQIQSSDLNEPFNSQENHDRIYPCNNNTKTTTKTTEGLLVVPGNIACSEVKS